MRASGVPTRIVGGYQGGTWNALGEFLTVRHSDAHVWCEVWLQGKGWVRVDPTFAVAPDRIESGIESALSEENRFGIFGRNPGHLLARWTEMAHLAWDAVNIRWHMWFMGFSAEDQTSLLKRIGISVGHQGKWMLFMVLAPLFIVIVTVVGRLHRKTTRPPPKDEALKVYRRFLSKMARIGLPKAPYQGPLDYARFVVEQHPTLKREVSEIADCYIALRYGHEGSLDALRDFRMHVRRFSPEQRGASRRPNRSSIR
jgi:hypothetical protein